MKVLMQISPKVQVEIESDKQVDVFEQLASAQEVFGHEKCGKCGSEDVAFSVRKDKDDNKYYELKCNKCRAVLAFGVHKKGVCDGGLFPRRGEKLEDGTTKWFSNGGWTIWNPKTKQRE